MLGAGILIGIALSRKESPIGFFVVEIASMTAFIVLTLAMKRFSSTPRDSSTV
jgi:hypothetical protein